MTILETYLLQQKLITEEVLLTFQSDSKFKEKNFLAYVIENEIISAGKLSQVMSELSKLPITNLNGLVLKDLALHLLTLDFITLHYVLPLVEQEALIEVAMVDPLDTKTMDLLKFYLQKPIQIRLVRYDQLTALIKKLITENTKQSLEAVSADIEVRETGSYELLNPIEEDEPIINLINQILIDAIHFHVSDIHFEPYEKMYRIRFRQDGLLRDVHQLESSLSSRLTARLKIMARLNIAEHRLPQDGHFKLKIKEKEIDVRFNSCPTLFGEKIVLRLLSSGTLFREIMNVGLTDQQLAHFKSALAKPQGLILVTGPTGSGKSATLYAALKYLNAVEKNISTVEDPVEINFHGINQVNILPKIGLNFAAILRAFLRQDPDIMMVGEIRDAETAEIAVKAAQTGHLVLSTLHTNSALDALTRLYHMGINAYELASSLLLLTGQRLLRQLCSACKKSELFLSKNREVDGFDFNEPISKAVGCEHCLNGYSGRVAIHEMILIDDLFRELILKKADKMKFENLMQEKNILFLKQSGLEIVKNGITSLAEYYRVLG